MFPDTAIIVPGPLLLASEMMRTSARLAVGGALLAIGAGRLASRSAPRQGSPPDGVQGVV